MSAAAVDAAHAARVLASAQRLLGPVEVEAAYGRMAHAIQATLGDSGPLVLVCMTGGMIPAAALLARMEMALELDYVHATRYRGGTAGHDIEWRVRPSRAMAGRHVLVVDDILDEGHTLAAVLGAVRAAGAASVRSAVLVVKRHARRVPGLSADFAGVEVADRYVFGCGMDYHGWHRQLGGIYAVAEDDGTTGTEHGA